MPLPNFLIIGTAKAGTSSLSHLLNQHPQVFMSPVKEPRFFTPELYTQHRKDPYREGAKQHRDTPMSLAEYRQLFAEANGEVAIGESSTEYIYIPGAAERIYRCIPDVKLIAILRDPAERAFSAFCYQWRDGCEKLTFEQALAAEPTRIKTDRWWPGWHYKQAGFYYNQLVRYFSFFGPSQIKICLYEDLASAPLTLMKDIFEFIGVEEDFVPALAHENASGMPRNRLVHRLMTRDSWLKAIAQPLLPNRLRSLLSDKIHRQNLAPKPQLQPEIRQRLVTDYRQDILNLQDLIQLDLSAWLSA